jgi:dihydrofolate reductase
MAPTILALVAAAGSRGELGKDGRMPWHLPADLRHFKTLTLGKPVVMGRKTFLAIGKPLPQRRNIVVSRDQQFGMTGCETVHSLDEALALVSGAAEVMVIGGGEIYRAAWQQARRMYLTRVHATFDADTFFPVIDATEWREMAREDRRADADNPFDYSFITLERI